MRVMRIVLNGDEHRLDGHPTVTALLAQAGYADRRVAVEVNREVVPRSLHPTYFSWVSKARLG